MSGLTPPNSNNIFIPPAVISANSGTFTTGNLSPNSRTFGAPIRSIKPNVPQPIYSNMQPISATSAINPYSSNNLQQEFITKQPVIFRNEQPGIVETKTTTSSGGLSSGDVKQEITTRENVVLRNEQPGYVEQRTTTKLVNPDGNMLPMTQSKPSENYWETPEYCHPGRQPYKCPIGIYIFIIVLMAVINIWAIFRAPRIDNNGRTISTGTIWWAAIIGVAFHLIFGLLIGWWIFEQCRSCNGQNRHVIFILAIGVPILLGILTGIIIGNVMNIGFLWTASREPNPESSNVDF